MRALMAAMLSGWRPVAAKSRSGCPTFILKSAPVSGVQSLMDYQLTLRAVADDSAMRVCRRSRAGDQPVPVQQEDLRLRRATISGRTSSSHRTGRR